MYEPNFTSTKRDTWYGATQNIKKNSGHGRSFSHSVTAQRRGRAKFIVPDWEDKVDTGKGSSYRPDRLQRLAGRYKNPILEPTIPHSGTMNLATCSSGSNSEGPHQRNTEPKKYNVHCPPLPPRPSQLHSSFRRN